MNKFVISFNPASKTLALRSHVSHYPYIGITMDTEKTVDKTRIRVVNTVDHDDPDACIDALQTSNFKRLAMRGIYHHKHMIIVSLHTPWEYTNPHTRITSTRHVFYIVFNCQPDPRATFLAILESLDILCSQREAALTQCRTDPVPEVLPYC